MKRIGGKSIFNYKTMKMENQPVDNFSNHKRIKIYVQDDVEPVETFLNDINFNTVCFTREELIDVTYTVVKSIFDLINYYQKYPQWVGKYTIHSGGASTDCVTKK